MIYFLTVCNDPSLKLKLCASRFITSEFIDPLILIVMSSVLSLAAYECFSQIPLIPTTLELG